MALGSRWGRRTPMAAIQGRNGSFRVLFRYQGKQHAFTLGKGTRAEADAAAANIDYVLMHVRQRLLAVPPGVDIVTFVRHDGDPPRHRIMSLTLARQRPWACSAIATSPPTATEP